MDRLERRRERKRRLDEALAKLRRVLPEKAAALGITRAILFGSAARGEHDWRSDIDLVAVQNTTQRFVERGLDIRAALDLHAAFDLLVYTQAEWNKMQFENSFARRISREGEVIYASVR